MKSAWPDSERREARPILCNFSKNNFFDRCLAAPIVVVAGEDQIAAALKADKFIRTGSD